MAKSKLSETKEERRARKAEKKASKDTGVTKPKSEKKDKKDKKKREVLAEKALNEITNDEISSKKKGKKQEKQESEEFDGEDGEDGDGDAEVEAGEVEMSKSNEAETKKENIRSSKGKMSLKDRPVGALVPFAHPLADEKVAKKVFRGVKKGECHTPLFSVCAIPVC